MVFDLQLLKKNGMPLKLTQVMLADGVTESLRLKSGTKVLLSDPQQDPNQASWIVPMGCLNHLHHKLEWKDGMRTL